MIVSLREFALSGMFGPISIGMQKEDVIAILGKPEDAADFGTGFSGIIYGWYEFFFDNDNILDAIQNDHFCREDRTTIEYRNHHFEVDPWFLRSSSWHTLSSTQEYLRSEAVPFQLRERYDRTMIRLESGVYFDFDDDSDDPDIIGIRYFPNSFDDRIVNQ